MSLSIAAIVAGSFAFLAGAGGAVGYATHRKQQRSEWAAQTWRNVTLRDGVTERSPFHTADSSFNLPGMVEVFPRSHTPNRAVHAWEHDPLPGDRPRHTSDSHSDGLTAVLPGESLAEELPSTPLELSDPPDPAERARCRRLYGQGLSQTKTISAVWGLSKGGSRRYYEARRRFREHVRDIARPDLLISLEAEEGQTDA
ncbi:hypothetical protein [Leptolyngbya sp. BC1307]|uniref:hypothetical protein n=1 Tax=Leptolyngbya sp. BC1307 TaxID=2029589 RepID=UPI000EFC755C|nr:hypothetical protein [Leptolyngbya sp. BC1307]